MKLARTTYEAEVPRLTLEEQAPTSENQAPMNDTTEEVPSSAHRPIITDIRPIAPPHSPTTAEIQKYLPLVHQAVARFLRKLPPNVLRDDLVAAGTYGLIDSLRKNGGDIGPTFEWYARIRIRGAIVDELRTQDWLTRRARNQVTAAAGEEGTAASRASVIGFDDLPGRIASSGFADEDAQSPLDAVAEKMDHAALATAVASLPERERYIVQSHYFEGVQFKTIAQVLGVSEPRISQLHARAVTRLRTALSCSDSDAA
jgi:RNA polymerase sigma factor FliA